MCPLKVSYAVNGAHIAGFNGRGKKKERAGNTYRWVQRAHIVGFKKEKELVNGAHIVGFNGRKYAKGIAEKKKEHVFVRACFRPSSRVS